MSRENSSSYRSRREIRDDKCVCIQFDQEGNSKLEKRFVWLKGRLLLTLICQNELHSNKILLKEKSGVGSTMAKNIARWQDKNESPTSYMVVYFKKFICDIIIILSIIQNEILNYNIVDKIQ